jgi:hypothetical protein
VNIHYTALIVFNVNNFCAALVVTWLRHCTTSQKVVGSSPDEVIPFNLPNSSSRIMVMGSTQLLTEMSARNLPVGGKGWQAGEADNCTTIC